MEQIKEARTTTEEGEPGVNGTGNRKFRYPCFPPPPHYLSAERLALKSLKTFVAEPGALFMGGPAHFELGALETGALEP